MESIANLMGPFFNVIHHLIQRHAIVRSHLTSNRKQWALIGNFHDLGLNRITSLFATGVSCTRPILITGLLCSRIACCQDTNRYGLNYHMLRKLCPLNPQSSWFLFDVSIWTHRYPALTLSSIRHDKNSQAQVRLFKNIHGR
jgi:hypothetical protein